MISHVLFVSSVTVNVCQAVVDQTQTNVMLVDITSLKAQGKNYMMLNSK